MHKQLKVCKEIAVSWRYLKKGTSFWAVAGPFLSGRYLVCEELRLLSPRQTIPAQKLLRKEKLKVFFKFPWSKGGITFSLVLKYLMHFSMQMWKLE